MSWLSCILSNIVLASLLALLAHCTQRWLKRPAVARTLWVLVLIKLVTPPLVSMPLGKSLSGMTCALGVCSCGPHSAAQSIVRDGLPWAILGIWVAGAIAMSCTALRRWIQFRRLLAHARPAPPEWQSLATRLADELSIRRPEILTIAVQLPPMVLPGWGCARVLLPAALLNRLSDAQKNALLMHELIHIQRRDHFVRFLELTVGVVYWWFPIVGSIGRQLRSCEESYCDAAVVAHLPQVRRDYALLLLDVLDFAAPLPTQATPRVTAMSAVNDLEQRLRAILESHSNTARTMPAGVVAFVVACAIFPCGLRFDVAAHPPVSTSANAAPAAATTPYDPAHRDEFARFSVSCCPS